MSWWRGFAAWWARLGRWWALRLPDWWRRVRGRQIAPGDVREVPVVAPPVPGRFAVGSLLVDTADVRGLRTQQHYVEVGAEFGDVVSYLYMGECIGFEDRLNAWAAAERAYADLGYRTLSLDAFVEFGGYGKPLQGVGVRRAPGEPIDLHAEIYRCYFLGKAGPSEVIRAALSGQVAVGTYAVPSTEAVLEAHRKSKS